MLTAGINFLNFKEKKKSLIIRKKLKLILQKKNAVIQSLSKNYINSYNKKDIQRYKKLTNFRIIGMGGSTLGSQAIYDFLNHKIKFTDISNILLKICSIAEFNKLSNFLDSIILTPRWADIEG